MKRSIFYVVTFLSLFSINLFSQDAECKKSFVQTIGSAGIDEANQFISYDNGFLVSGTANTKYFIMHLTENGEILWNYEIDIFPGVTEKATSMVLDGQNLVVVGNSAAQNGSIFNFVLKFDISNKTIVWLKIYPAVTYSTSVFTTILHETSADSYFILGQTQENSSPGLGCDALWLKVNKSSGDVTSAKNVNLGSCETYTGAVLGTNGFIYGAGRFNNAGGGQDKFRGSLTKLDLNGNEIWSKLYTKNIDNDDARLYFQTIAEDNGSLILGGQGDLTGTSTTVVDVLVMKTNLEGEIIWHKEVNIQGASSELATKLVTKNNAYYLMVNSLFAGNNEYSLLKFDIDGNLLWTKRYGRQSFDRGNDLIITTDNIFVVGETKGAGFGGDEILIIKSDLEGNGFNVGCNILTPVIATTKNTISAFQAIANTNEYNINFPLSAKTVPVVPLNLQVLDVCAVTCVDTCKNGVIANTVPDAALENVSVECNGANSFKVKMKVCNIDSVTLLSTVPFVVYDKNPTLIQANIIYESVLGKDIKRNNCEIIEFNLDLLYNEDYYIVVNDNGGISTPFSLNVDFPSTNVFECNFENNILGFMTNGIDSTFITKTLITGESVQIGQETYSIEGNYVQNLSNIFGCDSTLFISINIINADLIYDFNKCSAIVGSTNMDYSEFTSAQNSSIQCGQIISSNINRANPTENKHSCTPGINNTLAMCVESKMDCTYNAGHERTVIFTLEITPNSDKHIRVNEIRFFEKSPLNYEWINGPSGLNNYPTKFGFRVLKNNIEVFKDENIASLRDWNERRFNFDNITEFLVKEKTTFRFEFLAYCPVGNSSTVSVWDMEDLSVYSSCVEKESRMLAGKINAFNGKSLDNVSIIKQQNLDIENKLANSDGSFSFDNFDIKDECEISVVKNDDFLNGISTLDLILIQRHILGLETFDTSSKYIAADVNNDTKISASDLVELRKLILGINERFSNNKSWRFCSELPSFNPSSKIIISEKYKVGQGNLDITDLNFKGIKIGDINNDSNINEQPDNRTNQDCEFKYSLQNKYGNVYELEIFSNSVDVIFGFQLALDFQNFEFINILSDQISLNTNNYNYEDNILNISYSSFTSLSFDKSKPIFKAILKSDEFLPRFNGLNLSFFNEVYGMDLEPKTVFLKSFDGPKFIESISINPNPFEQQTNLEYFSYEPKEINIQIFNISGTLLFSERTQSTFGHNRIQILSNHFGNLPGLYFVKLFTNDESHVVKLIVK